MKKITNPTNTVGFFYMVYNMNLRDYDEDTITEYLILNFDSTYFPTLSHDISGINFDDFKLPNKLKLCKHFNLEFAGILKKFEPLLVKWIVNNQTRHTILSMNICNSDAIEFIFSNIFDDYNKLHFLKICKFHKKLENAKYLDKILDNSRYYLTSRMECELAWYFLRKSNDDYTKISASSRECFLELMRRSFSGNKDVIMDTLNYLILATNTPMAIDIITMLLENNSGDIDSQIWEYIEICNEYYDSDVIHRSVHKAKLTGIFWK